jgi:hypothetical protein
MVRSRNDLANADLAIAKLCGLIQKRGLSLPLMNLADKELEDVETEGSLDEQEW